jgi:glycosyltransferase involved in cell wall biosynthesis
MRILHVIARMNVGGTSTYLTNLISGMQLSGIENLLAVGNVPSNEMEDKKFYNLNFVRLGELSRNVSPLKDYRSRKELKEIISEFNPDIIHSHTFKAGFLCRTIRTKAKLIHTFHGHHLYDPDYGRIKNFILNSIEKFLARRNAAIITIGKRVRSEILAAGIGNEQQMISIPPGIEPPKPLSKSSVLNSLGLKESRIIVLWMGRLTRVKRPDRVIAIAKRFPDIDFVIAGDGELRGEVESEASANVHILGVQNADEMWSIADIALLTSDSEGMPLTLIEAQMAGVPAVSTDVGSVAEIVLEGTTGFVTAPKIEDLCSKLEILINDDMLRNTMSMQSKTRSLTEFSIEKMVSNHLELYNQVISMRKV